MAGAKVVVEAAMAFGLILFRNELKDGVNEYYQKARDSLFFQITIDPVRSVCTTRAILTEIAESPRTRYIAVDNQDSPDYRIDYGNYTLTHTFRKNGVWITKEIAVFYQEDSLVLRVFRKKFKDCLKPSTYYNLLCWYLGGGDSKEINNFKDEVDVEYLKFYVNSLYRKHCTSTKLLCIYHSKDDHWGRAHFRRPRNVRGIRLTQDMRNVLSIVQRFVDREHSRETEESGDPYKESLLLTGPPKTGKTTIAELIAIKYNRPIYELVLNQTGMDDGILRTLASSVPPHSVILVDELEDQIVAAQTNPQCFVTLSGIKQAFDGVARLSHGTILLLTANSMEHLPQNFREELLRPGRVNYHCTLQQPFGSQ